MILKIHKILNKYKVDILDRKLFYTYICFRLFHTSLKWSKNKIIATVERFNIQDFISEDVKYFKSNEECFIGIVLKHKDLKDKIELHYQSHKNTSKETTDYILLYYEILERYYNGI